MIHAAATRDVLRTLIVDASADGVEALCALLERTLGPDDDHDDASDDGAATLGPDGPGRPEWLRHAAAGVAARAAVSAYRAAAAVFGDPDAAAATLKTASDDIAECASLYRGRVVLALLGASSDPARTARAYQRCKNHLRGRSSSPRVVSSPAGTRRSTRVRPVLPLARG